MQRHTSRFDPQLATLYAGNVEHVVEQFGKRPRRGNDGSDAGVLTAGQRGAHQRLRESENPVHRRAQFMADERQKV